MSLHIDANLAAHGDPDLGPLFKAEEARQQAMLAGDIEALASLLDDNAVYIHSSGVVDDEKSYLQPLRTGDVSYRAIDLTVTRLRYLAPSVVLLSGRATFDTVQFAQVKPLDNLFIMTWVRHADGWKMASWQSTPVKAP